MIRHQLIKWPPNRIVGFYDMIVEVWVAWTPEPLIQLTKNSSRLSPKHGHFSGERILGC